MLFNLSEIPIHLKESEFYLSLIENDESANSDLVNLPDEVTKFDLIIESKFDLLHLLSTLRFWLIKSIPYELIKFSISNPKILKEICVEFESDLLYLKDIKNVLEYEQVSRINEASRLGNVELIKYFHLVDGIRIDLITCNIASANGHLNCLKYAFENRWNKSHKNNSQLCTLGAASNGHLDCLRYCREHGAVWSEFTSLRAAENGHLDCLQYAYENGCRLYKEICKHTAFHGHLNCLQYVRERGAPWEGTAEAAARGGHLNCLKYAVENGCSVSSHIYSESLECMEYLFKLNLLRSKENCEHAARVGNLVSLKYAFEHGCPIGFSGDCSIATDQVECLKYLHEHGLYDMHVKGNACELAAEYGSLKCLKYAHEQGCPWKTSMQIAVKNGKGYETKDDRYLHCLQYIMDHGCPMIEITGDSVGSYLIDKVWKCMHYAIERGCPWKPHTFQLVYYSRHHFDRIKYIVDRGGSWDTNYFNKSTANAAANGDLDVLTYLHEHHCPWHADTCYEAAKNGHLHCLQYAYQSGGIQLDLRVILAAVEHGHVHCLQYIFEQKGVGCWNKSIAVKAAKAGHINCLQYVHEHGCPWDKTVTSVAFRYKRAACLQYALAHDCPWDDKELGSRELQANQKKLLQLLKPVEEKK